MYRSMQLFVGLVACLLLVGAPAEAHGPEELDKQPPTLKGIEEIVVTASRQPITAASSKEINMRDFLLRPHSTTQEIMNNVPGLLVVQHQGGGKAF